MWNPRENEQEQQREGREKIVAVAIDKDKFSQHALKWAADNILSRHQTIKLVHVIQKSHSNNQYSGLSRCPLNFLDSFFFSRMIMLQQNMRISSIFAYSVIFQCSMSGYRIIV